MITFEELKKQIDLKNQFDEKLEELQKILNYRDLYEIDLVQITYILFDNYIYSHFTEEGSDLIFRWLYEEEHNVEDLKDLWEYLVKNNHLR